MSTRTQERLCRQHGIANLVQGSPPHAGTLLVQTLAVSVTPVQVPER